MKSFIVFLVFVALAGQALSMRVRRQADESESTEVSLLQVKTEYLNRALWFCLQQILLRDYLGEDITKMTNRAAGICERMKGFGGPISEENQALLSSVADLFTEEQQQKCGIAGGELS